MINANMLNETNRVGIALNEIAAVEGYTAKPVPKTLAATRDRYLEVQQRPASQLDRVAAQLADSSKKLTADALAEAADEVIAARAAAIQRELVTRELVGATTNLTGEKLYAEFKAAIPTLWHMVDLRAHEAFGVIKAHAHEVPANYSNEIAWDDTDETRRKAWGLLKSAANSIGTAHGIRQRWRLYRFLSACQHDLADEFGLVENYAAITSMPNHSLPDGIGQTTVQWLAAAVRLGGKLWLPLSGLQDEAYSRGTTKQRGPALSGGQLTYTSD